MNFIKFTLAKKIKVNFMLYFARMLSFKKFKEIKWKTSA